MSRNGKQTPPRPRIEVRQAAASPEEAAAIAAAIEQFLRDTAPPPAAGRGHEPVAARGPARGRGPGPGGAGPIGRFRTVRAEEYCAKPDRVLLVSRDGADHHGGRPRHADAKPKGRKGSLTNPEVLENVPGHVIPILEREFDDFDNEAEKFLDGQTEETEFIGFRLKQGVYGQRQADVQMIRVKLPMGGITPDQMDAFADGDREVRAAEQGRTSPRGRTSRSTTCRCATTAAADPRAVRLRALLAARAAATPCAT